AARRSAARAISARRSPLRSATAARAAAARAAAAEAEAVVPERPARAAAAPAQAAELSCGMRRRSKLSPPPMRWWKPIDGRLSSSLLGCDTEYHRISETQPDGTPAARHRGCGGAPFLVPRLSRLRHTAP